MGDGNSDAIIIVTAVFLGLSLVTVCLRCFVRLRIVRAFGCDDALIVTAMVSSLAVRFSWIRTDSSSRYSMWHSPVCQLLYIITVTIGRLSIAITLLRLTVERIHTWILYAVMVLSTAVGIVFLFVSIFQCQPVSYYWNLLWMEGHCLDMDARLGIVYMYSGVVAACDFTMGILPVFIIWRLQMDPRTKVAVAGILGIACIASAAVIVRIPFLSSAKSPDFLHATTQISIWSNIEASLGITAGSLATVRPIIRMWSRTTAATPSQHSLFATYPITSKRRGTADSRDDANSHSTYASYTAHSQWPPQMADAIP
ncbi:hypothetical protein BDV38DRAFT_273083 [Aspergillus pseudotamarii]|uniref:Rhodopsin domain-containing protein n=1 Tax=Aspergillus pseudotamarii TaxID=132259 RepID=A0A5N6SMD0_ASPPS|nr:uncharacterized protein BDV38DRAFT_273083 [Aspergillus pseudotamarii]KAE8135039.1 hypothetical protein BDV38DRAFT_273083 [Aspergillus pseudotamarii]